MADFAFNVAKGRVAHYASLPGSDDALIAIPIEASGVADDAVLVDMDSVGAILDGDSSEQTTMGRKTLTNVQVSVDDSNDRVVIDCDDIEWENATGNAVSDILIAYDPDTTGGDDDDLIPLSWHDFAVTPDGSTITAQIPATGFFWAT